MSTLKPDALIGEFSKPLETKKIGYTMIYMNIDIFSGKGYCPYCDGPEADYHMSCFEIPYVERYVIDHPRKEILVYRYYQKP